MKLACISLALGISAANADVHTVTMKRNQEFRLDLHAESVKLNQRYNGAAMKNGEVIINNYQNASAARLLSARVADKLWRERESSD